MEIALKCEVNTEEGTGTQRRVPSSVPDLFAAGYCIDAGYRRSSMAAPGAFVITD